MILKNIKPYLASQLRGRVSTVEEMVRLGQQLEKDHLQQLQYDYRLSSKHSQAKSKGPNVNRPADKPQVQCWRCKGHHAPGNCSQFTLSSQSAPPSSQHAINTQPTFPSKFRGRPGNNSVATTNASPAKVSSTLGQKSVVVQQQLIVPVSIGTWIGKAIVDTGASYTLIHESLWKYLDPTEQSLSPWTLRPLYLANGKAEVPLGWLNVSLKLHDKICPIPVAVLTTKAFAYCIVLGLDFIFFSGMQIKVSQGQYSFISDPDVDYFFQPGHASVPSPLGSPCVPGGNTAHHSIPSISLLSSVPPLMLPLPLNDSGSEDDIVLINQAVDAAHLPPDHKQQLSHILQTNPQVCTLRLGWTDVLQHQIYTHHQIPIKQRPYQMSPSKQAIVNQQLQEMLVAGIVEPSQSGWSSPVVLVPKKNGQL